MKKQSIVYCSTIEVVSASDIHSACIYSNSVKSILTKSKFAGPNRRVRVNKRQEGGREGKEREKLTKAREVETDRLVKRRGRKKMPGKEKEGEGEAGREFLCGCLK